MLSLNLRHRRLSQRKITTVPDHKLSDYDPNVLHERLVSVGREWAQLDGDARHRENSDKSVFSQIYLSVEGKTVDERKAKAYAHPDYLMHLDRMTEARTKANLAKVEYDGAKAWLDVCRTQEASNRALLTMR